MKSSLSTHVRRKFTCDVACGRDYDMLSRLALLTAVGVSVLGCGRSDVSPTAPVESPPKAVANDTGPEDLANTIRPAVSLRLSLSANSGQVVFVNSGVQSYSLYRYALSLSASGKTQHISPYPIVFPQEMPITLTPGATVTWQLLVKENNIYPYSVSRGGICLLEKEHKIKAVYQEGSLGRLESNTVTYKTE